MYTLDAAVHRAMAPLQSTGALEGTLENECTELETQQDCHGQSSITAVAQTPISPISVVKPETPG